KGARALPLRRPAPDVVHHATVERGLCGPFDGAANMSDFTTAYPSSRKVLVDGPAGVKVPMREIALGGGERPLRVYDTSGPQGFDVTTGLPKLREAWIAPRRAAASSGGPVTQLHYARRGEITPEMEFVAVREGL